MGAAGNESASKRGIFRSIRTKQRRFQRKPLIKRSLTPASPAYPPHPPDKKTPPEVAGATYAPYSATLSFRTGRYCAGLPRPRASRSSSMFQTPSERGGIVLPPPATETTVPPPGFKPLQNGAVLCCTVGYDDSNIATLVSNPFRTGRYCAA